MAADGWDLHRILRLLYLRELARRDRVSHSHPATDTGDREAFPAPLLLKPEQRKVLRAWLSALCRSGGRPEEPPRSEPDPDPE